MQSSRDVAYRQVDERERIESTAGVDEYRFTDDVPVSFDASITHGGTRSPPNAPFPATISAPLQDAAKEWRNPCPYCNMIYRFFSNAAECGAVEHNRAVMASELEQALADVKKERKKRIKAEAAMVEAQGEMARLEAALEKRGADMVAGKGALGRIHHEALQFKSRG
jgi:hypothetical protein